jgi:hypothetical protein
VRKSWPPPTWEHIPGSTPLSNKEVKPTVTLSMLDFHGTSIGLDFSWFQGPLNHKRFFKPCQGTFKCIFVYISMLNINVTCSVCYLGFSLIVFNSNVGGKKRKKCPLCYI